VGRWDEVSAECADNNMDMIELGNEMGEVNAGFRSWGCF
jgi:hypothetical protein